METEKHEAKKRKRKHKKRKRGGEDPTISVPSTSPPRDPLCHKAPTRNIDRNGRGVFSSKEEGAATHPPPAGIDLSIVSTFASLGHNEIKLEKIRRYIELKKESAALYAEICQPDDEEIAQADDEIYSYDEFLKIYKVTDIHFSTCGHRNKYQTCFLNVVLHCFAFTRPFLLYLRGDNYGKECCESDTKWCLLCGMRRYIRLVTDQKKSVYPEEIISHLQMFFHGFILGLQQDAYEFMIHARKKMELDFFDKHGGDLHAPKKNIIHHLFGGVLRSQVTCYRCENVSATYDEMQDLAVEIEGSARARSLQDCLDLFTTTEDVDYKCPRCKEVKAKKRLSIYESPNILTIILKRFKDAGKLDQFIYYPMELDITEHTSSTVGDNWYDLYAVVTHAGRSPNCGHYMCYVKDYEGRWLLNDDKKVTIISEDRVRDKDAYMLCYIRRTARPEPPIDIKQTMEQKQDDGRSDPHQRTREMEKKEHKTRTLVDIFWTA